MSINFHKLKYNLYHLLNVEPNSQKHDIEKSYRRIIKKFHPDKTKLTEVEEELYYEITQAYYILGDDNLRNNYDHYLFLKNNNNQNNNNHKEMEQYFPETKEEAFKGYMRQSKQLYDRHNFNYTPPTGNLNQILKEKSKERSLQINIDKEDFKDMGQFNDTFLDRKKNGNFSDKIIEYNDTVVPYNNSKLNYTELRDFHSLYTPKDRVVRENNMTSLSHAFLLQPHKDINEDFDYNEKINEIENTTFNNNFTF